MHVKNGNIFNVVPIGLVLNLAEGLFWMDSNLKTINIASLNHIEFIGSRAFSKP